MAEVMEGVKHEVPSKGKVNAALTTGIIGTALGALNTLGGCNGNPLGGLLGGGCKSSYVTKEEFIMGQELAKKDSEEGTTLSLIKGVLAGIKDHGGKVGGFNAYITSDVLIGAGLSSSAAFETVIGTITSGLYNDMTMFVRDYNVDRFRCDCGNFPPSDFGDEGIARVKNIKPDIFVFINLLS